METQKELDQLLNKAKIGIMTKQSSAFICTILFSLKQSWDKGLPTAGTDGEKLIINPDFFSNLTSDEQIGLLAHEAWHVAFSHVDRGRSFDKQKYNIAADYVINIMLVDAGFILPDGAYIDDQYRHMSTEEVYDALPDSLPEDYDCDIIPIDNESASDMEIAQKKLNIKQIIMKAAQQSKIRGDESGTIPGDIQRMIDELTNPKLDWFTILMNYMTAFDKTDFSFRTPNRRFFPDFFLPGLHGESMNELALAFDASASVSNEEFSAYYGETKYMRELVNPVLTTIIDFDTQINNIYSLKKEDSMDNTVVFNGGGGTNLQPIFDHYKKNKPTVLIIFSDLYCSKIIEDPGYPVVWISVNNKSAEVNFGTLIHYDLKY